MISFYSKQDGFKGYKISLGEELEPGELQKPREIESRKTRNLENWNPGKLGTWRTGILEN